jgi:CHAT domain-containing protein
VNSQQPTLAAVLICLPLTTSVLAAPPRGCDAAWSDGASPRLVQLDEATAALKIGSLVIARAQLRPIPALSAAMQPGVPLAASLRAAGANPARWRVRGPIRFDDECTLEVDAESALENPDAQTTRAARALSVFGQARAASEDAQPERAADLAQQALMEAGTVRDHPALAATIAAFSIERLIDQRQLGRARQLAEEVRPHIQAGLDRAQPAALRFELAAVRLLAWPEALAERERLQVQLDATFGPRSLPALENRVRYANNLLVLNRNEEALAEFGALESILRDDPRPAPFLRILLTRSHANALSLQGQPDAQLAALSALRADLVRRYGAEDRRVVDVDDDIARGLADAARLPEALALAARVFLWRDQTLGPAHSRTQESARLLALLYGRSGRYGTARVLLEDLLQRLDPQADMGLTIRAWRDIATWAALDGEPDAALELMGQAHRGARERFSADSVFAVGLAIDYGWLLVRAGDTETACPLLDNVRAHAPPANGLREWAEAGYARCLLARSPHDAADEDHAVQLLRGAYAAALASVGADNPRTLIWQSLLAGAELRSGHRAEAKRLLTGFVHRAERNREELAAGSALRDSTFGMWIAESDSMAGYRTLALLHAQDGELDDALRVAELARDRQLRDRFAERRWVQLPDRVPERATLRALRAQRQHLDESIAVAGVAQRVRLEAERIGVVDALDRLERELALRFPQSATPVTPTVAAIQARLPPDTALVAYQRAGDAWWITFIDARSARVQPIPDSANLAVAAHAWARSVRGEPVRVWVLPEGRWRLSYLRPADAMARVPLETVAQRLGAALFGPFVEATKNIRRLVVVADDELIGLPLDALAIDADRTLAVARYEISYAASFGGWIELRDRALRRSWPRDLLAIGALDDTVDTPAVARAHVATHGAAIRTAWDPLPFARSEITQIARSFPPSRVRTLLGQAATKESLAAANRSGELAGYRFVHFATHALVEPAFAERAALVLATSESKDAYLTATELAGLEMNSELVVLSACDTGVGRYEQGQGLLGFAFAALAAGNGGAVLSLWPVADETTARLMARFYARLREGLPPAAALAATKREFIRSPQASLRDARVWAAFMLYGGS